MGVRLTIIPGILVSSGTSSGTEEETGANILQSKHDVLLGGTSDVRRIPERRSMAMNGDVFLGLVTIQGVVRCGEEGIWSGRLTLRSAGVGEVG